jgi:hypothetical protein
MGCAVRRVPPRGLEAAAQGPRPWHRPGSRDRSADRESQPPPLPLLTPDRSTIPFLDYQALTVNPSPELPTAAPDDQGPTRGRRPAPRSTFDLAPCTPPAQLLPALICGSAQKPAREPGRGAGPESFMTQ